LNTSDYKQARYLRDKYLMPVLAVNSITDLLENLKNTIDRSKLDVRELTAELNALLHSGDIEHRITIKALCAKFSSAYRSGGFAAASLTKLDSGIYASLIDGL